MKVLTCIVFFALAAGSASAQTPEFYLILRHYFNEQIWPHPLYLGYDANASDSLEGEDRWLTEKGGEQSLPPFFGENDVRLTDQVVERDSTYGFGTWMDIRHKPDSVSFQLTYEITFIVGQNFQHASMVWANSVIPPIIKNVILEPATVSPAARTKTDMKQVSEFSFPNRDSINKYRFMLITFYYNREYLSKVVDGAGAVKMLSIVENPVSHWLSAVLHTEKAGDAKVVLLDISGRIVHERSLRTDTGANPINIDCSMLPNGAYKLVAYTGKESYSQTVIVNK